METVAETSEYVLIYKPAGTALQSRDITVPDLYHLLLSDYKELSVINRLDQPVEGLVLFAKNKKSAAYFSEQLRKDRIGKEYLCVVHGEPEKRTGRLVDWLLKNGRLNRTDVVKADRKGSRRAELEYEVLETKTIQDETYSLLKILLITGRHHQIRVQLSHWGYPLAGDRKYGIPENRDLMIRFPALCAFRMTFNDPVKQKPAVFTRLPEGEIFHAFKLEYPET